MQDLTEMINSSLPYVGAFAAGAGLVASLAFINKKIRDGEPEPGVFYQRSVSSRDIRRFKKVPTRYRLARITEVEHTVPPKYHSDKERLWIKLEYENKSTVEMEYKDHNDIFNLKKAFGGQRGEISLTEDLLIGEDVIVHQWGSWAMAISLSLEN